MIAPCEEKPISVIPSEAELPFFGNSAQSRDLALLCDAYSEFP